MNTMTLPSGAGITVPGGSRSKGPARRFALPPARPVPVWLPAPKPIRVAPIATASIAGRTVSSGTELRLERYLMLLLAGAGVLGIAYGFSCLIDLVEHWAVFNAGVGQLIQ